MPSGFLTLPDGRCFAKVWRAYDVVLFAIALALEDDAAEGELARWLTKQIPDRGDEKELGWGAWLRVSDDTVVERRLDLRRMTPQNQRLFCAAVLRAATVPWHRVWKNAPEWLPGLLDELADMVRRCEREEDPLLRSNLTAIVPPEDEPIGPGWD